jgi:hypothetical protein
MIEQKRFAGSNDLARSGIQKGPVDRAIHLVACGTGLGSPRIARLVRIVEAGISRGFIVSSMIP